MKCIRPLRNAPGSPIRLTALGRHLTPEENFPLLRRVREAQRDGDSRDGDADVYALIAGVHLELKRPGESATLFRP
jgi:hypothetical protein